MKSIEKLLGEFNVFKANNTYFDQQYSSTSTPLRYLINEDITNSSTGSTNSFQNIISLEKNELSANLNNNSSDTKVTKKNSVSEIVVFNLLTKKLHKALKQD